MSKVSIHQFSPRVVLWGTTILSFLPLLLITLFPSWFYFRMDGTSYLLFHNVAEFFSIMVSLSIFGVGWHTYRQSEDRHALFLSAAFLSIGITDFMHTLASAAMPAFVTLNSTNKSSQFWVAARLLTALALLLSSCIYSDRTPRWLPKALLTRSFLLTTALALPILVFAAITFLPSYVPDTFIPGVGLTAFKVYSEYLIVLIMCLAALAYWKRMRRTGDGLLIYYVAAFVICVAGELVFTAYKIDFDIYNVLGHTYKVAAFYLIYRGIFVASVRNPYLKLSDMNRRLDVEIAERRQAQDALQAAHDDLEQRVQKRTKALRESEQRFATTLESIGDAVIATDREGNILFMNAVAESLTGWTLAEVKGKPINKAFNIINEFTRKEVESPVDRVIREGTVVGLANHTVLIRKDGTEIAIDDSGAPIRSAGGAFTGVVLVFRDITGRREAEQKFRESEERFTKAFFQSPSPMIITRPSDGVVIEANDSALDLFGFGRDEIIGRRVVEDLNIYVNPERDRAEIVRLFHQQGKVPGREVRMKTRSGRILTALFSSEMISFAGEGNAACTTLIDITERKQAEEALRESELKYRRLFENIKEMVAVYRVERDAHGQIAERRLLDCNAAFLATVGASSIEEVRGKTSPELMGKGWEKRHLTPLQEAMDTGEVEVQEVFNEESGRHYITTIVPLDADTYMGTGRDITMLKQAEETLRKSRDELELRVQERTSDLEKERKRLYDVLETLPIIVDIIRPDYRIEWANRAFRDALGDNQGRLCYESQFGRDKPCDECQAFIPLETGRPHHWEWTLPNGRTFDIHNFPFADTDGSTLILEMDIDITEQRRMEEQLRQAQKMEALGTLTGGIAHDFNNILAAILGFTELSLDDATEGTLLDRNLRNILKSSLRARDLIRQMLTFSRKSEYEIKPMPLTPLVKETAKLLRASIPSTIRIDVDASCASDMVEANATGIQQILMNLCTNAAYAMRETGGKISITLSDAEMGSDPEYAGLISGQYLKLAVSDTGAGMNEGVQKRIFEPFFTTKAPGEGTGMGLAVVYGIVKNLKGEITVESARGKGSTFQVLLPKVIAEEELAASSGKDAHGGTEHVLLVDDEEMLVELGKAMLRKLGYRVTAVTDSAEALNLFREEPSAFDLIVTDQTMPGLTGVRLAYEALKVRPDMPVILCTGYSESVDPDTAKAEGIRDLLMKPLARRELGEAVRKALDTK